MWVRLLRSFVAGAAIVGVAACAGSDDDRSEVPAPPTTALCDTPPPGGTAGAGTTAEPAPPSIDSSAATAATSAVVVVGDSITEMNLAQIDGVLAEGGIEQVRYAALGARRIAETYDYLGPRPSGLEAIDACRDDGLDPDVWVIELGTNDVPNIAGASDPAADAGALIDGVLDRLDGAPAIVWVNVLHRDLPDATRAFNDALAERAAGDPSLYVADWYGAAVGRPDWFDDDVHPNRAGAFALSMLYLEAVAPLVSAAP